MTFLNPFANYGKIVYGEYFIGRKDALRDIENRVVRPKESGNLVIIGLPRIGKSSIVYKAFIERKKEIVNQKLIPIWINLATCEQASTLLHLLVTHSVDELGKLNWLSETIKKAAKRVLENESLLSENYNWVQRFFQKVRKAGYRIIFILDEFDYARHLFRDNIVHFQRLRDLSDNPEWRVNFITTSRRSIRDIELQTGGISTLDGIFHKSYLAMFSEDDLEKYFERVGSIGVTISSEVKKRILFYCGGYPYLLGMIGYEIVELFREKQNINVDEAAYRVEQSFCGHYDRLVNLLRADGNLNKILQILFGPVIDVKPSDVNEFLRYGLIKQIEQKYMTFSAHFHTFLSIIEHQVDLWTLWRKTEKALRIVIATKMLEHYGKYWIEELEKTRPNLKKIFDKCRETQLKEEKAFGSRASRNLIDFTYPQDLFAVIFAEWNVFSTIFGKDTSYWGQRAQLLGKIRVPLAHSRDESLYEDMRNTAEGYCKEILRVLGCKKLVAF